MQFNKSALEKCVSFESDEREDKNQITWEEIEQAIRDYELNEIRVNEEENHDHSRDR